MTENQPTESRLALARKSRKVKIWIWVLLGTAAALSLFVYVQDLPPPFGMYDAFAKCIAATETKFYGAYWCPHCQNQKKKFGNAAEYLPYIECSLPDGSGQTQVCIDNNVKNYPTWVFPDGSRLTGEVPLATLSEKTGCPLPTSTNPS